MKVKQKRRMRKAIEKKLAEYIEDNIREGHSSYLSGYINALRWVLGKD